MSLVCFMTYSVLLKLSKLFLLEVCDILHSAFCCWSFFVSANLLTASECTNIEYHWLLIQSIYYCKICNIRASVHMTADTDSLTVLEIWPWPQGSSKTPFGGLGLGLGWPGLGLGFGLKSRPRPRCNSRNEKQNKKTKQRTNTIHNY